MGGHGTMDYTKFKKKSYSHGGLVAEDAEEHKMGTQESYDGNKREAGEFEKQAEGKKFADGGMTSRNYKDGDIVRPMHGSKVNKPPEMTPEEKKKKLEEGLTPDEIKELHSRGGPPDSMFQRVLERTIPLVFKERGYEKEAREFKNREDLLKERKKSVGFGDVKMADQYAEGGKVEGKNKPAVLAIMAKLKKPEHGMEEMGEPKGLGAGEESAEGEAAYHEGHAAAAEEIMSAIKSGDKQGLMSALKNFYEMCKMSEG